MKPANCNVVTPFQAKTVAELFPFPRWIGFFPIALWPNDTEIRVFLGEKYAKSPATKRPFRWKKFVVVWSIIAFYFWIISDGRNGKDPRMTWFWDATMFGLWVNAFILTIGWRFMFAWQYIRDREAIQQMLNEGRTSLPSIRTIVAQIQAAKALEQRLPQRPGRKRRSRGNEGFSDPGLN